MTGSKQELLKVTTAGLAEVLTSFVESPVIEMTGLQGTYQIGWEVVSRVRHRDCLSPRCSICSIPLLWTG